MKSYVKNKAAMCCALGKKRMTEALRSCDFYRVKVALSR